VMRAAAEGARRDLNTDEADRAADSGMSSLALYPVSKHLRLRLPGEAHIEAAAEPASQPSPSPSKAREHAAHAPRPPVLAATSSTLSTTSGAAAMVATATPPTVGTATPVPPVTGSNKGGAGALTAALERHSALAQRLLGKMLYGVNYEGEVVSTGVVAYPANVNVRDFLLFSFAPVLVYEPNYPRTQVGAAGGVNAVAGADASSRACNVGPACTDPPSQRIRIGYLVEKAFLATGIIAAGLYVTTHYLFPVIQHIREVDEVEAVVQLVFPMMALMLLSFFLLFECILNAFAELTYFGDR